MAEEKKTLLEYLICSPEEAQRVCCREMEKNQNIRDYSLDEIRRAACNLGKHLSMQRDWGPHIPLFMETSCDFLRTFFGVLAAGKIAVPMHTTSNEETLEYILGKVHARCIAVAEPWLYRKLAKVDYVRENIHTVLTTAEVIAEKSLPAQHIDIAEIFGMPLGFEETQAYLRQAAERGEPDAPIQIIFTSGTTGLPKGAVLTNRNVVSCVVRAANHLHIDPSYRTLTFLPLSHVMGQNEVFIGLVCRAVVQIVGRENLLQGLKAFRPNILVSVPRVYQAIHQGIQKKLRGKPLAQKLIEFTVKSQAARKRSPRAWKRMGAGLFVSTLGRILTGKIRANLGSFRIMVTAGASCPEYIYDFYEAIGMPLTNAQGLTEVSGAIVYNNAGETLRGSIGYPLPGVEVRIDEDGEILFRGDPVFPGYFEEPEANEASFAPGGWFRTGDLGRVEEIGGKPYIFLEGRKKEIVVLSSGVNVPPVQIEERLLEHDIIHQVVIVGDGRPSLGALIVPESTYSQKKDFDLREEISKIIRQVNAQADSSEKIANFEILSEPFTVENGMLTPTLKMRRPVIFQHYKDLIGQLYNMPA